MLTNFIDIKQSITKCENIVEKHWNILKIDQTS